MKRLKHILITILVIVNFIVLENVYAESFSNYSSLGGSTDRTPNKKVRKSCKTYTCGPISTIELSMTPTSDVGSQNYNMGENSTFDQMLEMGDDINKFGLAGAMKQMRDVQNLGGQLGIPSDRTDVEKEIKIEIPMIDYGFSGTFSKILISVSNNDNKLYSSTTRGLTTKDDHGEYTGSITIEKYTPYILKGSYSAPLTWYRPILRRDMRLVGQPNRFCPAFRDPSTPACTTYTLEGTGKISGRFNILSPWKNDDRLKRSINVVSSYVDPLKNDIKGKMAEFGIDIDVDKEFAKAGFGSANSSSGSGGLGSSSSSSTSDIYGGCNCSCNFVQSATPQCKTACSAAFAACSGERYKPPQTPQNNNIAASLFPKLSAELNSPKLNAGNVLGIDQKFVDKLEKGEIKTPTNLRKKYISILEKNHPGSRNSAVRKMMIMGFDSMPDDKSKMVMFKSIGGN